MTDNNNAGSPEQGKVVLPKPPQQDVWGRDLPLPIVNPNQKQDDAKRDKLIVNSIEKVVAENSEIFSDIVKQFKTYTDSIRSSNQNFLLKQGRLMLAEMRKSFLSTMADEAAKSGDDGKAGTVNYTLRVVTNNLDRLIKIQEDSNKAVKEKLDKANKVAGDTLQTAQDNSKETDKDRKARAKTDQKAELARKRKDAEDKEDLKEGKLLKGIKKFIFGKTSADRREEEKNRPKRKGGLLDSMGLDFSFGGIASLITKIAFGAAGLFAVLGTDGVKKLFTELMPVFGDIVGEINKQIIEPMMQSIFTTLKDVVIKPAFESMIDGLGEHGWASKKTENEPLPQTEKNKIDHGPNDAEWLDKHKEAELTRAASRTLSQLYDYGNVLLDRWMKQNDVKQGFIAQPNAPVIMNSDEYADSLRQERGPQIQAANDRKDRQANETPLPYAKPVIEANPLSKQDMMVARMAQEDENRAKASRIADAMGAKTEREDALPQSFKDSVNNFFGTVAKKLDDERKKEKADIADKKAQIGNAFGSWFDGFENNMREAITNFQKLVSPENEFKSMLDSMDSSKHNDFKDMVESMDKYKATTDRMKLDSQRTSTPAPIIVQAPSTVNQSTTVSNGTTINPSISVGNNRKFLGR